MQYTAWFFTGRKAADKFVTSSYDVIDSVHNCQSEISTNCKFRYCFRENKYYCSLLFFFFFLLEKKNHFLVSNKRNVQNVSCQYKMSLLNTKFNAEWLEPEVVSSFSQKSCSGYNCYTNIRVVFSKVLFTCSLKIPKSPINMSIQG